MRKIKVGLPAPQTEEIVLEGGSHHGQILEVERGIRRVFAARQPAPFGLSIKEVTPAAEVYQQSMLTQTDGSATRRVFQVVE